MALSGRQQRFVEEYTCGANGAAAARNAGYSTNRAKVTASELLKNPQILKAIEDIRSQECAEHAYTRSRAARDLIGVINAPYARASEQIAAIRELALLFGLYPSRR